MPGRMRLPPQPLRYLLQSGVSVPSLPIICIVHLRTRMRSMLEPSWKAMPPTVSSSVLPGSQVLLRLARTWCTAPLSGLCGAKRVSGRSRPCLSRM